MCPTDKAITIAPTAASHREIAVSGGGRDSIPPLCAADGPFASEVSRLTKGADSGRQRNKQVVADRTHNGGFIESQTGKAYCWRALVGTLKPHCSWGPNGVSVWVWQGRRELAGGHAVARR